MFRKQTPTLKKLIDASKEWRLAQSRLDVSEARFWTSTKKTAQVEKELKRAVEYEEQVSAENDQEELKTCREIVGNQRKALGEAVRQQDEKRNDVLLNEDRVEVLEKVFLRAREKYRNEVWLVDDETSDVSDQ